MANPDLHEIIERSLLPLIGPKYVLLEVPYYTNIGDILIWEGERQLLSKLKGNIGYSSGYSNYDHTKRYSKDTTILLQGGGNWGDIWKDPHALRKEIVALHPENRIVVFPQTIYYREERNLIEDSRFWSQYPNVTICARDAVSFGILSEFFPQNNRLLLPDMAFCMDIPKNALACGGEKVLFAKRKDKELDDSLDYSIVPECAEVHDWPTFEGKTKPWDITIGVMNRLSLLLGGSIKRRLVDCYWERTLREQYIRIGIDFLMRYHTVYTTRLHIGILAAMMGRRVFLLDNNYGKLRSFYDTWMKDFENVSLV